MNWITLVFMFLLYSLTNSYEILLVLPVATSYVNYVFCGIAKSLISSGNKVTLISMHPPNFSHKDFSIHKIVTKKSLLQDLNQFKVNSSNLNEYVADIIENTAESMWESNPIKDILEQKNTYDAIVIPAFLNEIAYPFLQEYEGVFVTVYSQGAEHYIVSHASGTYTPINPSLDDPYFGDYSPKDKLLYSVSALSHAHLEKSGVFPGTDRILVMAGQEMENLREYRSKSHLNLVDGHFALNGLTPLMPKQIEIGTIVAKPPMELPQFLQVFLRSGMGEGIIYVSFGRHTKSSFIPKEFKEALVSALSQMPYKVLWQYDGMDLNIPNNILIRKVMPQQDILGHPSTRLFISHCSLPAMYEAAYHGVPVVAVPVAFDQHNNVRKLIQQKLAIEIDWRTATNDTILQAAQKITNDEKYLSNARRISRVIKDQKEGPGDRAAWWIEYVIRHEGAPHLQYDSSHHTVNAYCDQQLLKTWAVLALAAGAIGGAIIAFVATALVNCIFGEKKSSKSVAGKKNN